MEKMGDKENNNGYSKENTFIFNWVDGYKAKLEALKTALEEAHKKSEHFNIGNRVRIFDHLTVNELRREMRNLSKLNFAPFSYVTVIILDNKCKNDHFIQTKDKVNVLIDSEILTILKTNPAMAEKPRLFVIQKLLDFGEPDENCNQTEDVNTRSKSIQHIYDGEESIKIYECLEFQIIAKERTNNFQESPFIEVFCRQFLENATHMSMSDIACRIETEIKTKYPIDILFGTNQRTGDIDILGKAADPYMLDVFCA